MKRFFLLGVLLVACSSNEDDTVVDASLDQSQEATAKDSTTPDVTKVDATTDAPDDNTTSNDSSDGTTADAILLDAPIADAITVDVQNGCVDNNACTSGDYCDKGTANCNGVGTCTAVPFACPQVVIYVCGCDKKTYINSCYAHKGLTSVAYTGMCE